MMKLAAFADEISPQLDEQIKFCKDNGIGYFELRGVYGKNVLDFDQSTRNEIKTKLAANGLAVACVGSPIGKVKIDEPWEGHFQRFKIAVEIAEFFAAPLVRIFSYYPPSPEQDIHKHRDEVMRRMRAKVDFIKNRNIVLVHENERAIYGQSGKDCLDLLKTIDSPKLRAAFDPANFVLEKENPLDNWKLLKPYTAHLHVKDATKAGKIVPAGQGDGQIETVLLDLKRSGYDGFLTLEPHLQAAGQFSGFTGPTLFKVAVDALKALCAKNGISLAGARGGTMPQVSPSKPNRRAPLWPAEPGELRELAAPERLLVPLSENPGAESKVKPAGTIVRKGQTLVDMALASAHVPLAPADGILGSPQPVKLTHGRIAMALELLVDREGLSAASTPNDPGERPANPPENAPLVTWIDHLRKAGAWADRHNSPDLIGQLNQVVSRPIDTVICTVLDADANSRLNAALAARHCQLLAEGVRLLARITGARRGVIAVEALAGAAWAMPVRVAATAQGLQILELNNDYPQADPTLMLYTLTRRRLKPGNLPTTQGALILDAAAALEVGRAAQGHSALRTPLAVHDHPRRKSHLLSVVVGTPLSFVLEQLDIDAEHLMLRGGDLPRDVRLSRETIIGGAELTIHVTSPEEDVIPQPCIRCAWCVEACPTLVQPAGVLEAAQRHDRARAERAGIGACIECGLCSHVCPSRLPLLDSIRHLRALMAEGVELKGWER